jgi:DNA-binding response OmpR family regulator
MSAQPIIRAFDVDPASILTLREAFPAWTIEAAPDADTGLPRQQWICGEVELLVVGIQARVTEAARLCRMLRSQPRWKLTPLLVLVPLVHSALVSDVLEAGANSCLVLPIDAKEVVNMVRRAHAGNQPGRHTLDLDQAQREDQWRDDGGQG